MTKWRLQRAKNRLSEVDKRHQDAEMERTVGGFLEGLAKENMTGAKSRSHEEATIASFRRNPRFAAEYLNEVLEDGDQEELHPSARLVENLACG